MDKKEEIEELSARYFSGESTPEEIDLLTGWVQADPENRAYYQRLRNIWDVSHPAFPPADINVEKAHDAFINRIQSPKKYRSVIIRYWQYAAAILLLPLILSVSYLLYERSQLLAEVTYQEVFSPYGTHSMLNLPDGTVAWLNGGSSLRYPTVFHQGKRNVTLSGEAYFEVESDKENPFIVETHNIKVRATGTAFNVEAYEKDSIISVTMVEGLIDVTFGNTHPILMKPGERMAYNLNTSRYKIKETDPYKWYAWKDGMMIFRDDPLEYVFKKIGQTFNVDIAMKDTSIANHLYRATFQEESLDEILRLLQLTAPIRYNHFQRKTNEENRYDKQKIEVYKADRK